VLRGLGQTKTNEARLGMRNHIVTIGISRYQNIRSLQYANKDAKEFFYLFENNVGDVGFKKLLIDSEASLAAILDALGSELERSFEPGDAFFFFFSGHGAVAASRDGTGLANYLLPFDTSHDIQSTAISVEYLRDRFQKIQCMNKIIVIDSCFSGSINSKAYSPVNLKSGKKVKTFENTISGKGQVTFTASREDEEAVEDAELENGLFSYFFLKELQDAKYTDQIPVSSIHAPVAEQVMTRAQERYGIEQTPTFSGNMEGVVYLPVFTQRLLVTPAQIEIPVHPELAEVPIPVAEILIEEEKLKEYASGIVQLLTSTVERGQEFGEISLRRLLIEVISKLQKSYEEQFQIVGSDVSAIPQALAKLEAESVYLQLMACTIALYGNEKHVELYTQRIGELLNFGSHRSGLTALIDMPEVIIVEALYSFGIVCLGNDRLEMLGNMLNTKIYDSVNYKYVEFYQRHDIHYASSLGGRATTVGDHIRDFVLKNSWLTALCPELVGKATDYQLQANFLLGAFYYSKGRPLFADYGRFYGSRIMPLIARIRDDSAFRRRIGSLLGRNENEVIEFFKEYVSAASGKLYSGFFWNSITPNIFEGNVDFL
jgi:hypothetical protein